MENKQGAFDPVGQRSASQKARSAALCTLQVIYDLMRRF